MMHTTMNVCMCVCVCVCRLCLHAARSQGLNVFGEPDEDRLNAAIRVWLCQGFKTSATLYPQLLFSLIPISRLLFLHFMGDNKWAKYLWLDILLCT